MAFINVFTSLSTLFVLQSDVDPVLVTRKTNLLLTGILKEEFENAGRIFLLQEESFKSQVTAMQVAIALNKIVERAGKKLAEALKKDGVPDTTVKIDWADQSTFLVELDCSPRFTPVSQLVH